MQLRDQSILVLKIGLRIKTDVFYFSRQTSHPSCEQSVLLIHLKNICHIVAINNDFVLLS